MLAANRGADGPTIYFLLARTADHALEGLARRDGEVNSLLHLDVAVTLETGSMEASTSLCLDGITALLKQTNKPAALSPITENASGATPTELALEAMAAV